MSTTLNKKDRVFFLSKQTGISSARCCTKASKGKIANTCAYRTSKYDNGCKEATGSTENKSPLENEGCSGPRKRILQPFACGQHHRKNTRRLAL